MNYLKLITVIASMVFTLPTWAQETPDSSQFEKYSTSYEFSDGIYLSFSDFKNNSPIQFSQTNLPEVEQIRPEESIISIKNLEYYDNFGNQQTISIENVWGYCFQYKIYISWSGRFHLIPYIGNISHFVAKIIVYNDNMNDPFYNPYSISSGTSSYTNVETKQLILDTKNGNIYEFSPEAVSQLIKNDSVLFEEFSNIKKRKQKKLMFYYIRLYNDSHPIYFPKI
jgi:hypothetical protein